MKANKDKGTSVGFSLTKEDWNDIANGRERPDLIPNIMNKVCTEHEWVEIEYLVVGNTERHRETYIGCKNCGTHKQIDFKIKENLEVIENNKWEDIFEKWNDTIEHEDREDWEFYKWLELNYLAPIKKK